jgi:hypothetical protein
VVAVGELLRRMVVELHQPQRIEVVTLADRRVMERGLSGAEHRLQQPPHRRSVGKFKRADLQGGETNWFKSEDQQLNHGLCHVHGRIDSP